MVAPRRSAGPSPDGSDDASNLGQPGSTRRQAKSAKRLLKKRRRKESRFAADTNHRIAKQIVTEAERTGRGIALEDLGGIRDRVRLRRPQRVTLPRS